MAFYLGSQKIGGVLTEYSTTVMDSNDANVVEGDIPIGKIAYAKGKRIVGTKVVSNVFIASTNNVPDSAIGNNGDLCTSVNGNMWLKQNGAWAQVATNNPAMVPQGANFMPKWAWQKFTVQNDTALQLLLHGESVTDSGPNSCAISNGGGVSITTGKFSSALNFPSNKASAYLTVTVPNLSAILAGDFTFDWWEYRTASPNDSAVFMIGGANKYSLLGGYCSNNDIQVFASSNGSSWNIASSQSMGAAVTNQWVHRAMVRNGSSLLLFANGELKTTITGVSSIYVPANTIRMSHCWTPSVSMTGRIDEFRLSSVARWTTSFTLPNAPYVNEIYTSEGFEESTDPAIFPDGAYGADGFYYKRL